MIKRELLEILACPACKREVREEHEQIICVSCARRYPIRNGIPVMLISEAVTAEK